jgi:hypothetical protein
MQNIQLGARYRDRITSLEGIATGHATYISGCNQVLIAPGLSADGGLRESQWLDRQRLERVEGEVIVLDNGATPGHDRQAPKR